MFYHFCFESRGGSRQVYILGLFVLRILAWCVFLGLTEDRDWLWYGLDGRTRIEKLLLVVYYYWHIKYLCPLYHETLIIVTINFDSTG